jgi:hypothetical protein
MKKVKTFLEFKNLFKAEKGIVYIYFEWSGPAHIARKNIAGLAKEKQFSFPIYELNPEDAIFLSEWVREKVKDLNGYGSLVWLKNGKIVDKELRADRLNISEIKERTFMSFEI